MGDSLAFFSVGGRGGVANEAHKFMPPGPRAANACTEAPHSPCDADGIEYLDGHRAFVAVSEAMREVRRQVEQVASIDVPVLLLGESGTGKEVIARLIHKLSSRAPQKFLKVNCAALPDELLESEMFGYEAGAFTGARQARAGKFESCHKGTILLDEIGEMPVSPQAKLLQVLQDGEFSRLGSNSTVRADVRVLAATNINVRQAVQAGTFRADLYYRMNVFTIHLPPLREHQEDLPHLLNHFMTTWAACYGRPRLPITRHILEACASYPWPGNVRELESFVKRYLVLGNEHQVLEQLEHEHQDGCDYSAKVEDISTKVDVTGAAQCADLKSLVKDQKHGTERAAIVQALERSNGSKQGAASLLGISLRAVHYKIRRYNIEPRPRAAAPYAGAKAVQAPQRPCRRFEEDFQSSVP
ncbi:MAG: sigma 54-interacting transcriptional regulator [Terracidiphilus sp.]|jgi:two-component system response regulator AtoC